MKVRAMILGGILAMGLAAPALAAGSDLGRLFDGKTPLAVARENGSARVEAMLLARGAR